MYVVYPAVFYKAIDTQGYYVIFPDFEGGATQGDTEEDALYMAQDWLGTTLYDYYVGKKDFPKASSIFDVKFDDEQREFAIFEGSFISLVGLDIHEYVKKVDQKTIKKTLIIPSYLNEMGKGLHLNFSKILTEALEKEIEID